MVRMVPRGNLFSIYGNRSSAVYHKLIRMHMMFGRIPLHRHFCRSSKKLNVFSCKGSIIHNDSFFNICVCRKLMFFRIFFHIGKLICPHCISPFSQFYHSCIWLFLLISSKVDISHYDTTEDINEDNIDLFFFGMVYHKSVARDLGLPMGFWIFRRNNNTLACFHGTSVCIEYKPSSIKISCHHLACLR